MFTPDSANSAAGTLELLTRTSVVVMASSAPVDVSARVFGHAFVPIGTVAPRTTRSLDLGTNPAVPWRMDLSATDQIRVCVGG